MSLLDAVTKAGPIAGPNAKQADKKRYSEILSAHLAQEVAQGLRHVGFNNVKPAVGGPTERAFQGGLGPKKVDVSSADEQHGLLLAVSVKTINAPPFGKNLRNRFADLCTEAITLHMRFPYGVVCALFAFPAGADEDVTPGRSVSTFRRAMRLMATIGDREEYTDPGEKFENVTMMLFQPAGDDSRKPWVRLFNAKGEARISEADYFCLLREVYNRRNPHAPVGEQEEDDAE
jgi:hypothetical protein